MGFVFHKGDLTECNLYSWNKMNHVASSFVFNTYKGTP